MRQVLASPLGGGVLAVRALAPFAISFFPLPTFPSRHPPMALLLSLPHTLATLQREFRSQSDTGIISHILEGVRFRVKQPQERDRPGSLGSQESLLGEGI